MARHPRQLVMLALLAQFHSAEVVCLHNGVNSPASTRHSGRMTSKCYVSWTRSESNGAICRNARAESRPSKRGVAVRRQPCPALCGAHRVLVIQDASEEVSSSAIKWALHGLSLKPGDMLTLLGVLHLINSPLGYRSRIDSSMFGVNQNIVDMEVAGKKIEYENHGELKELSQLYETHKVELKIEVATGPSPKEVGLKIAQDLKATWIILDRTMKKDRKYFLQKLSCGISRMKRNNSIEQLRGPEDSTEANQNERVRNICLSYDEMIPGSLEHQELFSIELLHPRQTEVIQPSQVEALTQSSGGDEVVVEEWQPELHVVVKSRPGME
ncbi:uncharacterized protein [Populus alba]|uniref:uncharacterized protein n=1 Tax=Populus alba TaxID=43335 RepID=UPI003CC6E102